MVFRSNSTAMKKVAGEACKLYTGNIIIRELAIRCAEPNLLAYEVSSIKNGNPSIKFEGINLQKCLIACKKGVDVVVRFQYSEIG